MRNGKFNTTQYNLIQYELCRIDGAGPVITAVLAPARREHNFHRERFRNKITTYETSTELDVRVAYVEWHVGPTAATSIIIL